MMLWQGVHNQQLQRAPCKRSTSAHPERELCMCSRARAAGIRDFQADVTQGSPKHTTPWPGSSGGLNLPKVIMKDPMQEIWKSTWMEAV